MRFEIVDHFVHGGENAVHPLAVQPAETRVSFGEAQPVQHDGVVIVFQRGVAEEGLRLLRRLDRIAGQHPLVHQLRRRQRRLVAEQDIEKLQAVDMAADHHQTDGEGRRQHQPDRAPQPGPERRRKHDGDRREAGAASVHLRFHHLC